MQAPTADIPYQYNGIELVDNFGLNVNMATYRTLDPATGRWWGVDPKAEAVNPMSPYCAMGNSPVVHTDPAGDLFFAIPQIGFSSSGGLSLGVEAGVGIPGVLSASVTGGYQFGSKSAYWSVQGYAGRLYAGYGSSGFFAGFGYQYGGFSAGINFGSGGPSLSLGYGAGSSNGYNASFGFTIGNGGVGFHAGASSTYMWGKLSGAGHTSDGNGSLDQSGGGLIKGNVALYSDEKEAYNIMWEQSLTYGVETAAWLTDDGVLISPIEYGNVKNTFNGSDNKYFDLSWRGKTLYVYNNGIAHRVIGQIHTHPSTNNPLSDEANTGKNNSHDQAMSRYIGYGSVYAIAQKNLYRGYHTGGKWYSHSFGLRTDLLSGKIKLIP